MTDTAAIVVTYNRKKLLKECINNLKLQTRLVDIIIIDNMSTDGTKKMLRPMIEKKEIIYHSTGKNIGGAGGFYEGIKLAYKLGYKFFWLMDDDCLPKKDTLNELLKTDEKLHGNFGFLCSKVLWTDGSICKMNIPKISLSKQNTDFESDMVPIKMGTFVSFFTKREVVKDVGLPIKEFFIWGDDLEYSQRISKSKPAYLINSSIVIHKTKNNVGSNIATDDAERINRYRLAYRNENVLFRAKGLKGKIYQSARLCLHFIRIVFKSPDHKLKRLKTVILGTSDGIRFKPKITYISSEEHNKK